MPKSRGRKTQKPKKRTVSKTRPPTTPAGLMPPIDGLVRAVLRGGAELLEIEDPFEAEHWASSMLGTFYKQPIPLDARDELERTVGPAIVHAAELKTGADALAILRALAAVGPDGLTMEAQVAADRLARAGVPDPPWAAEIGSVELVDAWEVRDPYDDQEGYYATFRYPGRPPHTLMALYDENLGGIIKDALAAYSIDEPSEHRRRAEGEPGARVDDAEPGLMAARVVKAIEAGDLYIDNDWTEDFKRTRALLLSRMRTLPGVPLPEPAAPLDEEARAALIDEFLSSPLAPDAEEAASIVGHCLDARCDYGDGDPLRCSPIVVELFMLDFLSRKAMLNAAEIRALPVVLRAWVRFALTKRGLDARWIADAEEAVERFGPEFRRAVTDQRNFGPAKAIANAMLADGIDLTDERAVDEWIADLNARPQEDRDEFFGRLPIDDGLGR